MTINIDHICFTKTPTFRISQLYKPFLLAFAFCSSFSNLMATSLMTNNNTNVEPVRRGRKKAKNEQKKKSKEPQRGMGVEKLERMRIQEIMKHPVLNDPNLVNAFQYPKFGGGQMCVFGVGPGSTSFGSKSCVTEISNEAFSNKNVGFKCQSEYCTPTSCKKKKRFDGGNMDSGFLGLSVGDNQNNNNMMIFNQQNLSNGFKTHQVGYATRLGQSGVEVLAVHKKGQSLNQGSENLVMEYEFFPGCKKESRNDEFVMMNDQNMVAEASDEEITTCLGIGVPGSGFDSSVDLSLKLSY